MEKGLAETYYKKIEKSMTPALELAEFFCKLYNKSVTKDDIELFSGLSLIFGRFAVWNSLVILRMSYPNVRKAKDVINLLKGICKNNLKNKILKPKDIDYPDYTTEIRGILEEEEKTKNEQFNRDSSTEYPSK